MPLTKRFRGSRTRFIWLAGVAGAAAVALVAFIGLNQPESDLRDPVAQAEVPMDDVMRERFRMLTADRGMMWRAEPPDRWIGSAPDAELTLVGAPVTDAVLVVPAETAEQAYEAVIQYNVAIEAMIEAPPGLTRGWVESELSQWNGNRALDTSLFEFGFDATMRSSGEPRTVTLRLHRNPGAWKFEPCQGEHPMDIGDADVLVYFECDPPPAEPKAVVRSAGDASDVSERMRVALEALLAGPTGDERERGYTSVFPAGSEDLLASVELQEDGLAVVDFTAGLQQGNLNTAHNMFVLFGTLDSTVFQFDAVTAVEYRLEGSCDAFATHFQGTCDQRVKAEARSSINGCRMAVDPEEPVIEVGWVEEACFSVLRIGPGVSLEDALEDASRY